MSDGQPFPGLFVRAMRQQRWEIIRSGMGPQGYYMRPQSHSMGGSYDDLPIVDPDDFGYIGQKPSHVVNFESACKHGQLSTVQAIISSEIRTPTFLHNGLVLALRAGSVEVAHCLLAAGAPIVRHTPKSVLSAPINQQITLFELLTQHGWTPNTPDYYGEVFLPHIVTNIPLLRWFLDHGADPNLGQQRDYRERFGGSETDSCAALQAAAAKADIEAVHMLLDAGAKIDNGVPLHYAAAACTPGANPYAGRVTPSKEFDISRIPIMELLVERGADVNQPEESRHMVPRYAVVHAVMAGAVERVRWLLEHGSNPELRGAVGSAVDYAQYSGSEEMRQIVQDGVAARRWIKVSETDTP
jgi:ankyrin repeat protein